MKEQIQAYPLTLILIMANSVVYLLSAFLSHNIADIPIEVLVDLGALYGPYVLEEGEWWRLFTAMFLHGGMTHLLMNMFSLYLVGRGVEIYFDRKSYISIYLFSGLIGGMVSLYMHPHSVGVGASGAIFGIFGALAGFFMAHREKIATHAQSFMKDFSIILGLNLVIGLSIPSVDIAAHIGGLTVGLLGGFILAKNSKFFLFYSVTMMAFALFLGRFLLGEYVSSLV